MLVEAVDFNCSQMSAELDACKVVLIRRLACLEVRGHCDCRSIILSYTELNYLVIEFNNNKILRSVATVNLILVAKLPI
jgi:hypothetical protein